MNARHRRWSRLLAGPPLALALFGPTGSGVLGAEPVTYHEQVAPLIHRHCLPCHREDGDSAPFPLRTLEEARKHGREMADVTASGFMPPWLPAPDEIGGLAGERRLAPAEIALFRAWVNGGMAEGDPAKAVAAPPPPGDWTLGPPDLVVRMPAVYSVPPEGKDVYRHFVLPVNIDRKRWVRAWQFRPRSRAVHHIFVMLDRTTEGRRRDAADPEPGFPGMDTPVGIELPGTFLQLAARRRRPPAAHGHGLGPGTGHGSGDPNAPSNPGSTRAAPIRGRLLLHRSAPRVRQPVKLALINYEIDLPPGSSNVVIRDEVTLPAAADLLGLLPHSHYLCRHIEARAHYPDGRVQRLFRIPDWDFNWQGDYTLQSPLRLPAGTRLTAEFTFDNTPANPRNPSNPPKHVRYGANTTDEMAELWMQFVPTEAGDLPKFQGLAFERGLRDSQSSSEQRLRIDPRDARAMVNLGRIHLARRQPEEARRRFLEAAAIDPRADDAHYYLGVLHRLAGTLDQARNEFLKAVEINPLHARAWGNLGLLHLSANDPEGAARLFLPRPSARTRTIPWRSSTLGSIRLGQRRAREAVDLLTQANRIDPEDADTRRFLEMARRQLQPPVDAPPPFLVPPGR